VVLICISLMTTDAESLDMFLYAISVSLMNFLFKYFVNFSRLFPYHQVLRILYIF
jgi:hypothetical protein